LTGADLSGLDLTGVMLNGVRCSRFYDHDKGATAASWIFSTAGVIAGALAIIAVIIFLIFGAKKIPEIGKGIGGAIREFKNIGKEISGTKSNSKNSKKALAEENDTQPSMEAKLAKKVLEQVPGAKKVMEINDKVNKVKEIIQ